MKIVPRSTLGALSLALGLALSPAHAQDTDAAEPAAEPDMSTLESITGSGTLRVGVNPGYVPFSFESEAGERVGVDIELAKALAAALDVELEITAPEQFADLIPMLVDGKVDLVVAGMSVTFDRAKSVNFSKPYFDTGVSVMMNVGNTARLGLSGIESSDELLTTLQRGGNEARLTIAVTEGKAPEQIVMDRFPEATIKRFPTNEEAAEATLNGEANLMVHDEIFLKVWTEENAERARNRLQVFDPPIKADFYAIAAPKGDADWMRLLDVFVDELRAENRVRQWLGEYLPGATMSAASAGTVPVFDVRTIEE